MTGNLSIVVAHLAQARRALLHSRAIEQPRGSVEVERRVARLRELADEIAGLTAEMEVYSLAEAKQDLRTAGVRLKAE